MRDSRIHGRTDGVNNERKGIPGFVSEIGNCSKDSFNLRYTGIGWGRWVTATSTVYHPHRNKYLDTQAYPKTHIV